MKKKLLKISIVGRTNAGKSTLLNSIIGETLSIVNKKINTTEELILGIRNIKEHQLIFYDTPGLFYLKNIDQKKTKLKRNLWDGINESNLIIYLIDITKINLKEIIKNILKLKEVNKKIVITFNKNDLVDKKMILPKISELDKKFNDLFFFTISAKKKLGIQNLIDFLLKQSSIGTWQFNNNQISNKDDIFITNESTRNAILTNLHKEIPYNINIVNKLFKYLKNGQLKIKQDIEIKNLRYKKIILGKNGEKIKSIRIQSQSNISKILNTKVHLYINIIKSNAE